MNNFARFRVYMVITVVCAFAFLGIKSFEYNDKFSHYVVRLKDGKAITGHIEVNGKHPGFWNFSDQWSVAKLSDLKVEEIKIAVDPERWEIRDLYLDLVVRTGRGTDLVDVDELLEAHRGGLIDLVTAQQALLTAAAAIDGLASHGHDLDGWLSAAGMRLRWR